MWKTTLPLFLLFFSSMAVAQSDLELADKSFDLHAYQRAVENYEKVWQSQPGNFHAISRLAESYRMLNDHENAVKWFERALSAKGPQDMTSLQYGKSLMSLGQYDKAQAQFERYALGHPTEAAPYLEACTFARNNRNDKQVYKVESAYVSTAASDFGPAFWNDKLVWSSGRDDLKRKTAAQTAWTGQSGNQLFVGHVEDNGSISQTTFLKNDLKNKYNEGPVAFSADGKWVAYCKNNFIEGNRQIPEAGIYLSIFIAQVNENGDWANEKAFPYNGTDFSTGFPFLTDDGAALYFASDKKGGEGGFDLYVSYKRGDYWASPENLGRGVNTSGDEITPFMTGNTLYFASTNHAGFGGFDIFSAETVAGDWDKATNMGFGINSGGDDYGWIYQTKKGLGYFVSNRKGGKGFEDILVAKKHAKILTFTITDALDKTPLSGVSVDLTACGEGVIKSDANGKVTVQALQDITCEAALTKTGYKTIKANVSSAVPGYTIALVALEDEFLGRVLDLATQKPLAGATVRLMDQERKIKYQETTSAKDGSYTLLLRKNASYTVEFSKPEYQVTYRVIKTEDGKDRDILSATAVRPVYFVEPEKEKEPAALATKPSTGATAAPANREAPKTTAATEKTTAPDKSASEPAKKAEPVATSLKPTAAPVRTEDKTAAKTPEKAIAAGDKVTSAPTTKTVEPTKTATAAKQSKMAAEAFAVQLGVFTIGQPINMSAYDDLKDIGSVYMTPDADRFKLRVGVYKSKEEADSAKARILAKGYKGAFIVAEQENIIPADKKGETKLTANTETELTSKGIQYKVRLAAYKKPEFFDAKKVSDLGKIEQLKSGEVTIMLLGTFDSIESAEKVRQLVSDRGFTDAVVVIRDGNKLIKTVKMQ